VGRTARLSAVLPALTSDVILDKGGWHPRYARVLVIHQIGTEAVSLVDGNGDGAEVDCGQWFLADDGWIPGASSGIGPMEERPLWTWGWIADSGYVIGQTTPGGMVNVGWADQVEQATADRNGIWVCSFPSGRPPRDFGGVPRSLVPNNGLRQLSPAEAAAIPPGRPRILGDGEHRRL